MGSLLAGPREISAAWAAGGEAEPPAARPRRGGRAPAMPAALRLPLRVLVPVPWPWLLPTWLLLEGDWGREWGEAAPASSVLPDTEATLSSRSLSPRNSQLEPQSFNLCSRWGYADTEQAGTEVPDCLTFRLAK